MKTLITTATVLLAMCSTAVFAQDNSQAKLKDVQASSVWAPTGTKTDAKLNEWNDTFQAFNKSTKLYYTVANDAKFVYLVIKSTDATATNKVMMGGITVTVNTEGKKKTESAYSITYPVVARPAFGQRGAGGGGMMGGGPGGPGGAGGMRSMMASMQGGKPDSAVIAMRRQSLVAAKEIKVSGFKDIPDSLISLYNEYSVKAAANYDNDGNFLYEMAIPIKLMGLTPESTQELAYNVKLNGLTLPNFNGGGDFAGGPGGAGPGAGGAPGGFGGPGGGGAPGGGMRLNGGFAGGNGGGPRTGGVNFQEMISPTDFWGKYTLAKK